MTILQATLPRPAPSFEVREPAIVADNSADFDRRWAEWLAKGRVRDDRMLRRMAWLAGVLGGGFVIFAIWTLA